MLGTLIRKSSQTLFDLLYPPRCIYCDASQEWLCSICQDKIPLILADICQQCGTPINTSVPCNQCRRHPLYHVDGIRVMAYYEDSPLRSAIHTFKYNNQKVLAATLAEMLAQTYSRYALEADVIVPVPLHRSRFKERGYNQSELLARQLATILTLPVNTSTLKRARKTQIQMSLGADERKKNVSGAFVCQDKSLANQNVLLIDDVCTTGSTLDACAASLKQTKVASVWGLTLAKPANL